MAAIDLAQRYFDAWNRHDPASIVATFAQGGTYSDPTSGGVLTGQAIAHYADGLLAAFPDLSFEIVSAAPAGDSMVAAQWLMRGTNTGSLAGAPPTRQAVALPGADFITTAADRIRSVQGYFDQRTLMEQLGLQVIVQPYSMGPVSFGNSVYLQLGKRTRPGAFSLTALQGRSDQDVQQVRAYSQRIAQEAAQMPGFISALFAIAGHRMFTITAWEDTESPKRLLRGGAHKEAMDRFFGPDFTAGG